MTDNRATDETSVRRTLVTPVALVFSAVVACGTPEGTTSAGTILVGDTVRTFMLYAPDASRLGSSAPLVLVFHGGGGSGAGMQFLTGFDDVADEEGFVVAYPDAPLGNWAERCDCNSADRLAVNDTGFVRALIDYLAGTFPVDTRRVYAAGLSQGGLFVHRLACDMADRFAAVASVVGGISSPLAADCRPNSPISVAAMLGTRDPLFPFEGSGTGSLGVLGARETAEHWVSLNQCVGDPESGTEPDRVDDGKLVRVDRWTDCAAGTEVVLYTVEGGIHAWNITQDVVTATLLTQFFLPHSR